jgi:preprotein translocase subunit SecG
MVEVIKIILTVLEVIFSIGLITVVLLQSGKEAGLSGAISGNADTYMGKGKSGSLDQKLASWTKWIALVWALLTLALGLI